MRRSGETTREVDARIQELFTTGRTLIKDHYQGDGPGGNKHQIRTLLDRMSLEHPGTKLTVDMGRFEIRLDPKAEITFRGEKYVMHKSHYDQVQRFKESLRAPKPKAQEYYHPI